MNLNSIIESVLFAWAEPVSVSDFEKVLKVPSSKIREVLEELKEKYEDESSGLRIVKINDSYQLSTKITNYDYISQFVSTKNKKNLSTASLETLSIIAYRQPITKVEVEKIRGVKCDGTMKSLTDLGLIEITGQLDRIGKPNIYETTDEFLKRFGISSLSELPNIEDEEVMKNFLEEDL